MQNSDCDAGLECLAASETECGGATCGTVQDRTECFTSSSSSSSVDAVDAAVEEGGGAEKRMSFFHHPMGFKAFGRVGGKVKVKVRHTEPSGRWRGEGGE